MLNVTEIIENLPDELKIAMVSGCEMETELKDGKMTIRTKNKIKRDPKINFIS